VLKGIRTRGFPKRMTVFDTLNIFLEPTQIFDLTIEQDRSGDILVASRIQYAVNRMCNGMLMLMGQLSEGALQGHTVHIAMEESTLVFTSALLAMQFSAPEVMQPKLVRSVRAWADYCTPHGEGLSCDSTQGTVRIPLETYLPAADADASLESGPLYAPTLPPAPAPLTKVSFYPTPVMRPARTTR